VTHRAHLGLDRVRFREHCRTAPITVTVPQGDSRNLHKPGVGITVPDHGGDTCIGAEGMQNDTGSFDKWAILVPADGAVPSRTPGDGALTHTWRADRTQEAEPDQRPPLSPPWGMSEAALPAVSGGGRGRRR